MWALAGRPGGGTALIASCALAASSSAPPSESLILAMVCIQDPARNTSIRLAQTLIPCTVKEFMNVDVFCLMG